MEGIMKNWQILVIYVFKVVQTALKSHGKKGSWEMEIEYESKGKGKTYLKLSIKRQSNPYLIVQTEKAKHRTWSSGGSRIDFVQKFIRWL
jgi:hypothetical protein